MTQHVQSTGIVPKTRSRRPLPRSHIAISILFPSETAEVLTKTFIFYFLSSSEKFRSDTSRQVGVCRDSTGGTYVRVVEPEKDVDVLYSGRVQQGQRAYYTFPNSATLRYAEALFDLGCISEKVLHHHVNETLRLEKEEESIEQRARFLAQCTKLNLRLNKTQLAKIDKHFGTPKLTDLDLE